jgi:hypothetical protein
LQSQVGMTIFGNNCTELVNYANLAAPGSTIPPPGRRR